jgi:uncharacterized protein YozE (UPF0346 family)
LVQGIKFPKYGSKPTTAIFHNCHFKPHNNPAKTTSELDPLFNTKDPTFTKKSPKNEISTFLELKAKYMKTSNQLQEVMI